MPRAKAPCGTEAAYRRHLRNAEPMDAACRDAHAQARRAARSSPAAAASASADPPADGDDMELIVRTLRKAFVVVAEKDPTKLAPIARAFQTAVEATRGPVEAPKELSLAEQLAEARAVRAARTESQGAPA